MHLRCAHDGRCCARVGVCRAAPAGTSCHPTVRACRQVFLYLDRAYIVSNPGTLNVFQLGLHQLRCQLEALPHVRRSAAAVANVHGTLLARALPCACAAASPALFTASPQVHHRIVDSLLQLVEAERSGEAVNRHLLKHSVAMLANLRLYEEGARDVLLSGAMQYYSREGSTLINVRN